MPRTAFACLCAAMLALLPACASTGQGGSAGSAASAGSSSADSATSESSSGSDSSSESDSAPPTETSGTESARPPQGAQGTLTVASLPSGANVDGDGCMTINFIHSASEVPPGVKLVLGQVTFDPEAFEFGGSACSGETSLCVNGLVLTETSQDQCFASVRTTDKAVVGSQVTVTVPATVDCSGAQPAACAQFQEKLKSDADSQGKPTMEVPQPNEPETTPTDESPPPSSGDSDTSSSGSSDSDSDTTSSS